MSCHILGCGAQIARNMPIRQSEFHHEQNFDLQNRAPAEGIRRRRHDGTDLDFAFRAESEHLALRRFKSDRRQGFRKPCVAAASAKHNQIVLAPGIDHILVWGVKDHSPLEGEEEPVSTMLGESGLNVKNRRKPQTPSCELQAP